MTNVSPKAAGAPISGAVGDAAVPAPAAGPDEVTLDQAYEIATRMHRDGELDRAETLYRRILQAAPEHAGAANALGMLRHMRGASDEAVGWIERAIRLVPEDAGFHNNLGNLHLECGRPQEAIACYQRAVELRPDSPMVFNNLGHVLKEEQRYAEARHCFAQALQLDPAFVRVYANLGGLNAAESNFEGAIECYRRALELEPEAIGVKSSLARAYARLQRYQEAADIYLQVLAQRPDDPVAQHMAAAYGSAQVPDRAGDTYVERTFDAFASSFDSLLTERLGYRAPQLCSEAVERVCGAPAAQLEVLDAGCGTGLCAPLLRPWARRLHGVDLSRGMLDRAHQRGGYDELYKAELTQFLRDSPAQWQLIVSADTLCYFGNLAEFFAAASAALQPGAALVFTVEALPAGEPRDFAIQPHGRYAHADTYLRRLIAEHGLVLAEIGAAVLRTEGGQPVHGWVVAVKRLPDARLH